MKTTSIIFAVFGFMVIIIAITAHAYHQFAIAAICAFISILCWNESNKEDKELNGIDL